MVAFLPGDRAQCAAMPFAQWRETFGHDAGAVSQAVWRNGRRSPVEAAPCQLHIALQPAAEAPGRLVELPPRHGKQLARNFQCR